MEIPAFCAELELFTTVTKTSTPTFMAFSLKFGDKRKFFHTIKNHTIGCYQTFVTTYLKSIDLMFKNMQTAGIGF